jgi:hypothetical protein
MKLYDSETNDELTATELGFTECEYQNTVHESIESSTEEGHIRLDNGRRVYAK